MDLTSKYLKFAHMTDAKGLQELLSYFELADAPTEAQFASFINSIIKAINMDFADTDIDADGCLTITYPSSDVNGNEVLTEIVNPLYATIVPYGDNKTQEGIFMCEKLSTGSCKIAIGTPLPTGNYYVTMFYQF